MNMTGTAGWWAWLSKAVLLLLLLLLQPGQGFGYVDTERWVHHYCGHASFIVNSWSRKVARVVKDHALLYNIPTPLPPPPAFVSARTAVCVINSVVMPIVL